jgi:hypothetical protein
MSAFWHARSRLMSAKPHGVHLEAITCLYLWPWSALYKVLISVSRHLTLGQASDEYINLAVSGRPEIYKFLYRKYGAGSSANLVDKSRRDKMMNSFTRVQYTRRSNHTEDIISPLLLVCCLAGGSCSCRIIWLHGPWVGARPDGCPTNTRATCMDRPQSYSLMRCRPRSRGVGGCDS